MFNRNYVSKNDGENDGEKLKSQARREMIIELIKKDKKVTTKEMSIVFKVSKPTIESDIAKLRKENKLKFVGSTKSGYWILL